YVKLRDVMRVFDIAVGYDNATGTATLDTSQSYQRTPAEQAGMINASTEQTPPPASQVSKLEVLKAPKLEFYLTGNHTFTTAGFELRYWDEKGVPHVITDVSQMVFKVEGKEIKDGHVFTVSSMKTGTVGYQGLTAPLRFPVYQGVPKEEDPKAVQLADGKYNLSVLGNSVGVTFMGKMILDSKNPTIVCVKRVEDYYYLSWESGKATEYYSPSPEGGQLFAFGRIEASAQKWKITSLGGDTYSIRQYNNPSMLVCTAAAAKKDGTAVMVWKNTKTPAHASFTFTPAQ
ncbi:MAG: RICIN domain-containing protein, partial [Pseudoflavonifractor sp.]